MPVKRAKRFRYKILYRVYQNDRDTKISRNDQVFTKNFMKKSKISILVSDSSHKFLLIIIITFFD